MSSKEDIYLDFASIFEVYSKYQCAVILFFWITCVLHLPFIISVPCSPRSQLLQLKKEKLEYIPGEHEYGLFPAPIHVGESQMG